MDLNTKLHRREADDVIWKPVMRPYTFKIFQASFWA